ncbi:hypothetical protein ACHAW6_002911 [Cyclotella cf. meneghiniana]
MGKDAFWMLLELVSPNLPSTREGRKLGGVPNGLIMHALHLSMTLRFFARGGSIGYFRVSWSVWLVVDAIHQCPELNIVFLETHAKQTECANGLKKY